MSELQTAQESHEAAEQAGHEARNAYQTAVAAGDMEAARQAAEAARAADAEAQRWSDRVAALEAEHREKAQRQADRKLRDALKRAEEAAEAERQAGFELAHIHEQISVLHDKLKAATAEAGSASVRVRQAAEAAGRPVPKSPRSSLKREADIGRMIEAVRRLGRLLDQQEQSAVQASATARKAG